MDEKNLEKAEIVLEQSMSQYLKKLQLLTISSLRNTPADLLSNSNKYRAMMDIFTQAQGYVGVIMYSRYVLLF